jgi:sulfur-oxidizing protein SoxY
MSRLSRREVIQRAPCLAALLGIAGLSAQPSWASAAGEAFAARSLVEVFKALGGLPAPGPEIEFSVPEVVENGAVVPVTIRSAWPDTEELAIVVEMNPVPLAVRFAILPGTEAAVSTRIKLAQSGTVYAAVRAGGRLYVAARETRVAVGGCN